MNWLTNFVRPKIRAIVGKREVPDHMWFKCPQCGQMIFHRELEERLHVCPHCDHHLKLEVGKRLKFLFDDGAYQKIELPETVTDPLKFKDRKRYLDRLKEARNRTGDEDAITVAHGNMGGMQVVIAILDFGFMGGSMGVAVGEAMLSAAHLAVLQQAPLIVIPASGGARMQEGILSLMQMPRAILAVDEVKEAGLPYITLLIDPTTGGVSASFAMLGDIAVAEPGAVIGFAGARVIEETIREKLPEGFQRSEYLLEHGMLDLVVHRSELRETLIRILSLLCNPSPAGDVVPLARAGAGARADTPPKAPPKTEGVSATVLTDAAPADTLPKAEKPRQQTSKKEDAPKG